MGSERVEAARDATCGSGDELSEGAATSDGACDRHGAIEVRVSYAGECSVEEAVSRYLAARENVRDVIGDELD